MEKEITKYLVESYDILDDICCRLQKDYNGDEPFIQDEQDRLTLCYLLDLVQELKEKGEKEI